MVKELAGRTSPRTTACSPPDFVVIVPPVPLAKGPASFIEMMSGFHRGQDETSDQTLQTLSGVALLWSDREKSLMASLLWGLAKTATRQSHLITIASDGDRHPPDARALVASRMRGLGGD